MEEITVEIGQLVTGNSGITNDTRQAVVFTGEELGSYREFGTDHHGKITDTRGVTQTLYRVDDGRLVVHVHAWSRWVGEPDTESLVTVTEKTLGPTGLFRQLGAACGFGRPLTLDEAEPVEWPEIDAEAPGRETSSNTFLDWVRNNPRLQDVEIEQVNHEELTLTLRRNDSAFETQLEVGRFVAKLELLGWGSENAVVGLLIDAVIANLFSEDEEEDDAED